MVIVPRLFLQQLVQKSVISQQMADSYELASVEVNIPIDEYLLSRTTIPREVVFEVKADLLHVPYVDIARITPSAQIINYVPEQLARLHKIIAYQLDTATNSLMVAAEDPIDLNLRDFLESKTGKTVTFALADPNDIQHVIDSGYSQRISPEVNEALRQVAVDKPVERRVEGQLVENAPIAKIVNNILDYAVKSRASDVHIEPAEKTTRVRYRIDGILQERLTLPSSIHDSLVSRLKILSEMKIDEHRLPQDGRFNYKTAQEEIDLRVSTLPTAFGEKIVMRLLKKTGGLPSLNELGVWPNQLKDLEELMTRPYGIILVTGPTGSGKTTTLYSVLSRLNKPDVNIVTLEDPVEYQIPGINQVQINPAAGLTFDSGLRAFLRQDPNIILVGEIRDVETTKLAIQAALTGHLVFATLHTNNAATAIPRLVDLGGEPFLISSTLAASIAQRILRKLCSNCSYTAAATAIEIAEIRKVLGSTLPTKYQTEPMVLTKARGCGQCGGTGFLGRVAIFEILKITPKIQPLVLSHSSALEIQKAAIEDGFITMVQDGFLKALAGITTLEEVLRVAQD